MGMFIKFECDTCGEYECDCAPELRNKSVTEVTTNDGHWRFSIPIEPNTVPVCQSDMITSGIIDGKPIDNLYVYEITEDNKIMVENIATHERYEHKGPYKKVHSVIGEYGI